MDLKDLAGKILPFAQVLGSAIGGPVGLATTAAISLAKAFGLGADATPDEIDQAIKTDPQAALKLRIAEMDYNLALNKQKLDETEMHLKDMQNARQREIETTKATGKRDINQYILAWVIVNGFFGLMAILIFHELPKDQNGVVFMLFGALATGFGQVLQYYFGSSKGSAEKTALMAKGQ